ncbi:MAG TPA: hypothetical protein PLL01_04585 [Rhodoferax sp.]|nr:hypothetical protein [Rhodoferax sp.]HPW28651.1 hypothetical protein [Rhodoferax sp.]
MSVINKMLRDLDSRQPVHNPAAIGTPTAPLSQAGLGIQLTSKKPSMARHTSGRRLWMGVLGMLVALGVLAWVWMQPGAPDITATVAPAVTVAVAPTLPAASHAVASAAAASSAALNPGVGAEPGAVVLRMEESLSARRALDALLSTPAPVIAPAPAAAPVPVAAPVPRPATASIPASAPAIVSDRTKPRSAGAAPEGGASPAAPATAAVPIKAPHAQSDSTPAVQRQLQAGGDALAQAQSLWNSGSRDAAIDLMQQSIAAAERVVKASPSANNSTVLIALTREMARMQLAEGRYGAVWELLTRLEPQLGNQPDLWAIRANAAQRLGRHQDSVHAYMVALQSRPDEQRWLLGTAVSLAALGQTSSASEMAEKARAVGPVSKDILAYLRQAGVVFRD